MPSTPKNDGRAWLFGYGSLVSRRSAEQTLGRPVGAMRPAVLHGWRRRWSLLRDNRYCEKTFALDDGTVPDWILTLNVESTGDRADRVNGVLIEVRSEDLPALDIREVRYRRVEVSRELAEPEIDGRVITYTATHHHTAIATPPGAMILETYLSAVERGFRELSERELETFRSTTGEPPAPVVACHLLRHDGPKTSPAHW